MKYTVSVPGRVCVGGEHSDWASGYRQIEESISPGACLAYCTDVGIDLEGEVVTSTADDDQQEQQTLSSSPLFLHYTHSPSSREIKVPFEFDALMKIVQGKEEEHLFFSHVCATAAELLHRYSDEFRESFLLSKSTTTKTTTTTVKINCTKMSLPMKKGLSSSAAIAVGVAKLLSKLSQNPRFEEEIANNISNLMNIAYHGERRTGSMCGHLDQVVAFGHHAFVKLDFAGTKDQPLPICTPIHVKHPFRFVVCDLNAGKDTRKILQDLNSAYPVPQTEIDFNVHKALGEINLSIVKEAELALAEGDSARLGKILTEAQRVFDSMIAPKCPSELNAPKLHRVLEHPKVKQFSLGGKGVGSQGDGSAQFVCKDEEQQEALCRVLLEEELNCTPMKFSLLP